MCELTGKQTPRTIRVFYAKHKPTGLWKAESPDLKGLLIFDRSKDAIKESMNEAILDLLREEGCKVDGLVYREDSDWTHDGITQAV